MSGWVDMGDKLYIYIYMYVLPSFQQYLLTQLVKHYNYIISIFIDSIISWWSSSWWVPWGFSSCDLFSENITMRKDLISKSASTDQILKHLTKLYMFYYDWTNSHQWSESRPDSLTGWESKIWRRRRRRRRRVIVNPIYNSPEGLVPIRGWGEFDG